MVRWARDWCGKRYVSGDYILWMKETKEPRRIGVNILFLNIIIYFILLILCFLSGCYKANACSVRGGIYFLFWCWKMYLFFSFDFSLIYSLKICLVFFSLEMCSSSVLFIVCHITLIGSLKRFGRHNTVEKKWRIAIDILGRQYLRDVIIK